MDVLPSAAPLDHDAIRSPAQLGFFHVGDDYQLLEEIGRGGSAVVYRAHQITLDRQVAIKFLTGDNLDTPEKRDRFRLEAEVAAGLDHPGIISVVESGTHEGSPYLVMRLVTGGDLSTLSKPVSPRKAALLVAKVAEAIQFAHGRGILHRDLKPSNILLDEGGEPCVADFGLAKFTDSRANQLTAPLSAMGTPHYMSPEQCRDTSSTTTASDLFSLGVILHELLTGKPPFEGGTPVTTMRSIVEDPTPEISGLDPDLDAIQRKCLEKEPEDRYSSAAALAADLHSWRSGDTVLARPPTLGTQILRFTRRHQLAVASAAAFVAALIVATAISVRSSLRATAAEQATLDSFVRSDMAIAQEHFYADKPNLGVAHLCRALRRDPQYLVIANKLLGHLAYESFPPQLVPPMEHPLRISASAFVDQDRFIVSACDDGTLRVWEARTGELLDRLEASSAAQIVVDAKGTMFASFSFSKSEVEIWSASPVERIHRLDLSGDVRSVTFSPDGALLSVHHLDTVSVWRLPGLEHRYDLPVASKRLVNNGKFSPNGEYLLAGHEDVGVWDAESGALHGFVPAAAHTGAESMQALAWVDDDHFVTAMTNGIIQTWHRPSLEPVGALFTPERTPQYELSVVPGTRHLAMKGRLVQFLDVEGWKHVTPTIRQAGHATIYELKYSQDSTRVATLGISRFPSETGARIWDTGSARPLCAPIYHSGGTSQGVMARGADRLTTGGREKKLRLWDIRSKKARPVVLEQPAFALAFSPDGRALQAYGAGGVIHHLRTWHREDTSPSKPSDDAWHLDMKHDLHLMCGYLAPRSLNLLMPRWATYRDDVHSFVISPDGERLVISSGRGEGLVEIWHRKRREKERSLSVASPAKALGFDPEGTTLVAGCQDGTVEVWQTEIGQTIATYHGIHLEPICSLYVVSGTYAITGSEDGTAKVVNLSDGTTSTPMHHGGVVRNLTLSPSGRWLATGSENNTARVWTFPEGEPVTPPLAHEGITKETGIQSLFTRDESKLITGRSYDANVRVWDLPSGEPSYPPLPHRDRIHGFALSPDQVLLATAGDDGHLRVWHVETGKLMLPPLEHDDESILLAVAWSPDGRRVAAASIDSIRIWDVPRVNDEVPDWLPLLGEATAHFRLDEHDAYQFVDFEEVQANRRKIEADLSSADLDPGARRWVQWLLADPHERTVSPESSQTLESLINERAEGRWSEAALRDGLDLAPMNPQLMKALAKRIRRADPKRSEYLESLANSVRETP